MENEDKRLARGVSKDGVRIGYTFFCPACKEIHYIDTKWSFNGDFEKPTFSPSVLLRGKVMPTDEECDRILAGEQVELADLVCHSFITDGKMQYLS